MNGSENPPGLVLLYQPQRHLPAGGTPPRGAAVEALARWQHPRYGLLLPEQFIPLAEQNGVIASLTHWVLETALHQVASGRSRGLDLIVAVNLSARSLHDPQLPAVVSGSLVRAGLPASSLVLELTERAIMAEPERTFEALIRLHETGVRLSIDDFGTGYSSLAYLRRLPVDEIKIDRSFVQLMTTDENDAVIVRSTIELAHNLDLWVVAEGIEDQATLDQLAALGCDTGQGYYLGRPMSPDAIARLLAPAALV
jgi:EAL domain-containing protein (putative c-di-GMP-specific phosphodiesterase class I)